MSNFKIRFNFTLREGSRDEEVLIIPIAPLQMVLHVASTLTNTETYKTQLEALCMQIFEAGLTQYTQRKNEVECFYTCFRKAIAEDQQRGAHIVAEFERSRRQVGFFSTRSLSHMHLADNSCNCCYNSICIKKPNSIRFCGR